MSEASLPGVAALVARLDHSSSPLGPRASWPQSLKTTVGLMLPAEAQIVLFWGPDYLAIYNDAYAPTIGLKHPQALGRPAAENWTELWDDLEPLLRGVRETGRTFAAKDRPFYIERRGYGETVYFDVSYSAVPDEAGAVGGVRCIVAETTARVLAERRQAFRLALTDRLREAAEVGEVVQVAVAMLGRHLGAIRIGCAMVEPDGRHAAVQGEWLAEGVASIAGRHDLGRYSTGFSADYAAGRTVVLEDFATDPRSAGTDAEAAHAALGIRAQVVVPLVKAGRLAALLFVHAAQPRRWAAEDRALIEEVAERIWAAAEGTRTAAALRETAERYRLAARATSDAIWDWRLADGHVVWSEALQALFGHAEAETSAEWWLDHIHPEDRDRVSHGLHAVIDGDGTSWTDEYRFRRADGTHAHVFDRGTVLRDADGRALRMIGAMLDLSDRKAAEASLRDSEAKLQAIANSIDQMIWSTRPDGFHDYYNDRWYEFTGVPAGSTDGEAWNGMFHAEDQERAWARWRHSLATGEPYHIEYRLRHRSGQYRWVIGRAQPVLDAAGRITRWYGTCTDIHDLKETEAALRESRDRLAEETRALEILNAAGSRVAAEFDLARLVQAVVDAGVELTGARFGAFFYNLVDAQGESYTLYSLAGVDRSAFAGFPMPRNTAVFAPTFNGEGVVRSDDIMADPRYGHSEPYRGMPEGHLPVRSYLAVPVTSRGGEVIGGLFFGHEEVGVFGERSERVMTGLAAQAAIAIDNARLFEAVQRANAELEERVRARTAELEQAHEALRQSQKMEAVGQLTGGIAHDFNNMLAVVIGSLDLLGRRIGDADARARRHVQAATEGARRAALLTQRLLAFSRQQPLRPEPIEANRLLAGMSDLLRHSLGADIHLETVLSGGLWHTHADPNQLENAILNLAVNARDAMPGGGRLTIETQNAHLDARYAAAHPGVAAGQYVLVAVTDTGLGMPEAVIAKAFDPFFTTKEVGKGTGLGLSQVYGFVRQSGGHVKIYSEAGQGTTVKIYLPRHLGAPGEEAEQQKEPDLPLGESQEVVLVVEDEAAVRQFSVDALTELGYRVLEADGAAAALRLLERHPEIALMFSDVVMPKVNGAKLAEEARRRRPDLKVLFTTGYTRNAVVHNGVLDPGVQMIGKPFTIEELAAKLREVLDS